MAAKRLKSYRDVRIYLAGLINRVEADEILPEKAGRLTYMSNILLRAIELEELEGFDRRLAALEAREGDDAPEH